jgi:hypothetical protein
VRRADTRAPHKRWDAANNSSKTRLFWGTDGGPLVIPFSSGCLDASRALAHSGHNQRCDFGSRRQRAFTAALRIAFRAPSDVGATSEIRSDSSRAPNRQVPSCPRPSQQRSMRIHVSAVSSMPIAANFPRIEQFPHRTPLLGGAMLSARCGRKAQRTFRGLRSVKMGKPSACRHRRLPGCCDDAPPACHDLLNKIRRWARNQPEKPNKAEAIRRLVEIGLEKTSSI